MPYSLPEGGNNEDIRYKVFRCIQDQCDECSLSGAFSRAGLELNDRESESGRRSEHFGNDHQNQAN